MAVSKTSSTRSTPPRATTARRGAARSPGSARASKAQAADGPTIASFRRHGGRLEAARAAFPAAPSPWIDLSTGINPYPWPGAALRAADAARLPDPADIARLESTAAAAFGCDADKVAAVPGADLGLRLLPRILAARSVAIASPTYTGHREAWTAADVRVREVVHGKIEPADVVVVVNPNNPDGRLMTPRDLAGLAARQRARGGWLVVDESFIETAPGNSVARAAGRNLIVLRSFGKFYGLPGLRLGFVLGDRAVVEGLRALTGAWPVGAAAVTAGTAAYADAAWRERMAARLARAASRLDRLLLAHGFRIAGGTALFRLAAHPAADKVFLGLARAGILVRPFDHAPDLLRFGIPAAGAWTRLRTALEAHR